MDVYFFVFSLDQSTKNVNLKAKEENDKYANIDDSYSKLHFYSVYLINKYVQFEEELYLVGSASTGNGPSSLSTFETPL